MNWLLILFVMLSTACASTMNMASSPPEVEVSYKGKVLGKTPFLVDFGSLEADENGGFLMEMKKTDYRKVWLWIPKGIRGITMNINMQPFFIKDDEQKTVALKLPKTILNKNGAEILKMQTALLAEQAVDDAQLTKLMKANPESGAHLYLAALSDLRSNKKEQAIAKLKDAVRFSPGESDYIALLAELGVNPDTLIPKYAAPAEAGTSDAAGNTKAAAKGDGKADSKDNGKADGKPKKGADDAEPAE